MKCRRTTDAARMDGRRPIRISADCSGGRGISLRRPLRSPGRGKESPPPEDTEKGIRWQCLRQSPLPLEASEDNTTTRTEDDTIRRLALKTDRLLPSTTFHLLNQQTTKGRSDRPTRSAAGL